MSDFQDQFFFFDRKGGSPLKSRHIISLAVMLAMSFAFSYFDQAKVVSNGEAASAPPQFFWPWVWVEGGLGYITYWIYSLTRADGCTCVLV